MPVQESHGPHTHTTTIIVLSSSYRSLSNKPLSILSPHCRRKQVNPFH
jgi:hypothetical protein